MYQTRGVREAQVLDKVLAGACYDRVVYLGDGSGDFCPCTRLRPCDYALIREHYPTGALWIPSIKVPEDDKVMPQSRGAQLPILSRPSHYGNS